MTQNLYLFPDTNLFIQCKDLQELDWSEWEDFEEVHLIVCRPVQREIDDQRKRGNGRVASRARKTYSSLFRAIATRAKDYELIQESGPCVKLFLEFPSHPDPSLSHVLNYDKPDDEIVGCLHRYKRDHPEADARLLTDDTGPMMTAGGLELEVAVINQVWLLPPENNDTERENTRLKNELIRLKKQEPQFKIRCIDNDGKGIDRLELVHKTYEPLSEDETSKYIEILKDRFPIETEFNQQVPKSASLLVAFPGQRSHFEPASEEAISNYKSNEYPKWIMECRKILSSIHEALQSREGQPTFRFEVSNEGTCPGNDALVVIKARGHFKICPPLYEYEDDDSEDDGQNEPSIPSPPTPPRGQWRASHTSFSRLFDNLNSRNAYRGLDLPSLSVPSISSQIPRRDPNGFYYKPTRITEPADSFSLECEQWRHGTGNEPFDGDIYLEKGVTESSGALECEIHAENLSKPTLKKIPVKIDVRYVGTKDYVDNLLHHPWHMLLRSNKPKK